MVHPQIFRALKSLGGLELQPDFNCCNSFALSWVDKVTTGTLNFVSDIANFDDLVAEEITQFSDNVKMRLISQINKGISRVPSN